MKRVRIALLVLALSMSVAATAWATAAYVNTYTHQVSFTVENTSAFTFVCTGHLYAETYSGKRLQAYMDREAVPPGQYRYMYLYTDPRVDPFVRGWSDINCVTPPQ